MIITTRTKGQIRIQGEASNAKAGACVVTKDENVYYIENKEFWEDSILNKQVEVEGKLETIDTELKDPTRIIAYIEHQNIIKEARIKIMSE